MIWFQMKCLGVVFIRIKVKGYLKNITDNEILEFEEKGIRNKDKITYTNDKIKYTIKNDKSSIMLIREGSDFVNTFIFNMNNSTTNYLLKENNYSLDLDVVTLDMVIDDNFLIIKYKIIETENEYEFKAEMSEI